MRVLALDTTTGAGSVALIEDDRIIAEHAGDPSRSHAERLPGDLLRVLEAADIAPAEIDVFAVVAGPGSFTGIRIGIATMQGLAFVNRRPVVPVSALEALAQIGSRDVRTGSFVAAWVDAHRREVFAALYEVTAARVFSPDRLIEIERPSVGDPAAVLSRWAEKTRPVDAFVGDGAVAYRALIEPRGHVLPAPLLAGAVGLIAVARAGVGDTVAPGGVQPLYVRRPDAEVERERRSQK